MNLPNLYSRLTEKDLELFRLHGEQYPSLTEGTVRVLKNNEYVGQLTISEACCLSDILYGHWEVDAHTLYEKFKLEETVI
jgi:hypothetical protein